MAGSSPNINFHLLYPFSLKDRTRLKSFISELFVAEKKALDSLSYIFCDDDYLLKINQDYLDHDDLTDIITFDLSGSAKEITGEIYISVVRVKDNAVKFGVSLQEELLRVIFHGALHLCGYKDKTRKDIVIMRQKEEFYMDLFLRALKKSERLNKKSPARSSHKK